MTLQSSPEILPRNIDSRPRAEIHISSPYSYPTNPYLSLMNPNITINIY